jgi:hypothetical protein
VKAGAKLNIQAVSSYFASLPFLFLFPLLLSLCFFPHLTHHQLAPFFNQTQYKTKKGASHPLPLPPFYPPFSPPNSPLACSFFHKTRMKNQKKEQVALISKDIFIPLQPK